MAKNKNSSRPTRLQCIKALERILGAGTRVITYVTARRPILNQGNAAGTQIAQDSVRLIYDHLLAMKKDVKKESLKVALFLISNGGDTAVPWRIISMIREIASEFNVLVPYNAMSAATMIALGADNIYMGPKGELGPIDPTVSQHPFLPKEGNQAVPVSVEDVTSYIAFVKEKYGITHEDELIHSLTSLTQHIKPLGLGLLNRQHSYIRLVGERLLTSRNSSYSDEKIKKVLSSLIEEVTFHGHGISRDEAENQLGLHIGKLNSKQEQLEDAMWDLYRSYEDDFKMLEPIDLAVAIPEDEDSGTTDPIPLGAIESRYHSHLFEFQYRAERQRHIPNEIKVTFQLPPNFDQKAADQAELQKLLQHLLVQTMPAVKQALIQQSPVSGISPPQQIKARWEKRR